MIAVVDLFCGGGGFSEGAMQAGAQVVLSIDAWHPAVITHRLNHPNTPCLKFELGGSIDSAAALIKMYLPKGCHFHLHASPPCQALSSASRANPEDGMGLVDWVLELVKYMKPDSWSLENVLPLGKFLTERKVSFVKLNAAAFGVPQTRRRVFAGEGWTAKESHSKEQFVSVLEALPYLEDEIEAAPSMANRWPNLSVLNPFPTVTSQSPKQIRIVSRRRKAGQEPQSYTPDRPAHTITRLPGVIEAFNYPSNWVLNTAGFTNSKGRRAVASDVSLSLPSKTICNQRPTIRWIRSSGRTVPQPGGGHIKKEYPNGFRVLNEPSYTMGARTLDLWSIKQFDSTPVRHRSLTIEETATLQGWHDMKIPETINKKEAWQIIGNMVCPAVAKAIIEGIKEE